MGIFFFNDTATAEIYTLSLHDALPIFGLLAEVSTGFPLLLSELTLTTAIRTAATSVMAAKYLAKPNPKKMALIGNGCQSEFQSLGFHHVLGIEEIYCYDVDPARSEERRVGKECRSRWSPY